MKLLKIFGFLLGSIFCISTVSAQDAKLLIKDGWTRASVTKTSAAYMEILNEEKHDIVFSHASSDVASIVELHKTVTENNISQMVPINKLVIPANSKVVLQPKGLHIMLIGLKKPLVKGDIVPIVLHFEGYKSIIANAIVKE